MLLRSQIDSIVPVEYIGLALNQEPDLCKVLKADKDQYAKFIQLIHSGPNTVPVPVGIKSAKRNFVNSKSIIAVSLQDAVRQLLPATTLFTWSQVGVESYLAQLSENPGYPGLSVVQGIQTALANVGGGFKQDLEPIIRSEIQNIIKRCEKRVLYFTCMSWLTSLG